MTEVAHSSARAPRTIVCVKVDTLGDVVLFAPTLRAICDANPGSRIVMVIRSAYVSLAPLIGGNVEWITTNLDPFARGPEEDASELSRLREIVAALKPDVMLAATSRRNWLEIILAATSGAPRRIALGAATEDEFFATQLRVRFGLDANAAFNEHIAITESEPDWRRNFSLADALLYRTVARTIPRLTIDDSARVAADQTLASNQLSRGRYVVCAAAGFANVALKTWPAPRFAKVLVHLRQRHGMPTLLVGQESERAYLESVAALAGERISIWCGREDSLPELAGLLAGGALFVGNDTGAMHLAAALDIPVVAIFGGGTWPRFLPAARQSISVVHPLPCFGCGWDCAFGDAPCVGEVQVEDVIAAADSALANRTRDFAEIAKVDRLPATTQVIMGKAALRYRETRRDHLARQHKLEELTNLDYEKDAAIAEKEAAVLDAEAAMKVKEASIFEKENEINVKEREIAALKVVCDERETLIVDLDGQVRALKTQLATVEANHQLFEKTLAELPADRADAVKTISGQAIHIRNLEALVHIRNNELAELKASTANRAAGLHDVEQAKHYGRMLTEKETVIRQLHRSCEEREAVIKQLTAELTTPTAKLHKLWVASCALFQAKVSQPIRTKIFKWVVEKYWMQIGALRQYAPRPLQWDTRLPKPRTNAGKLPQIGLVTPSYGQERFIERTMFSVLNQGYPKLRYVIQDGGSKDGSAAIIARHAARLHHWESTKDNGQADAICRGFKHVDSSLGRDDVMAWLNSDDLLAPGVLQFIGDYFSRHPDVDVVYGHRIIIDDDDRDVGRWIMPRHRAETLEWVDYVPQETMFWRKRAWDLAGGVDPSFQFALDWDLLARFQQAGCKLVRVPYFLGAFRVHAEQKTSQAIHTTGADEMRRIRTRFHGEGQDDPATIDRQAQHTRFWGAITARLLRLGIRW